MLSLKKQPIVVKPAFTSVNEDLDISQFGELQLAESIFLSPDTISTKNANPDFENYFVCLICQGLVIDAVECSTCEMCFCHGCIESWIKGAGDKNKPANFGNAG